MIGFLVGLGMTEKVAKIVAYVAIPVLILVAFYFTLDAYGDARFREGRVAEEAAWKAAQDKLLEDAAVAKTKADREALAKQLEFAAKVEEEKEKVDDAIANGSSPFDVLFPPARVQP